MKRNGQIEKNEKKVGYTLVDKDHTQTKTIDIFLLVN